MLIRKDDKLLFVMRQHTGFMDGKLSLPAGHVEEAETYAQGAVREAYEEVGLTIHASDLRHKYTMHRWAETSNPRSHTDVFFEASDWLGEPTNTEPEKHAEILWVPIHNLPINIMDYQRHALIDIFAGNGYGEFGWEIVITD
jgi:8-oxo-dGTP diphosphatase